MKNKLLISLTVAACSCLLAAGLSACHTHAHTYSEEWTASETQHWHSATCEHTDEVDGLADHSWNEGVITQAPTCTEGGVVTYTCTVCGYERTESVAATGHDYVGRIIKEATCTEDGEMEYTCSVCGDSYTDVIKAEGHKYVLKYDNDKHWYECSVCGDTYGEGAHSHAADDNGTIITHATTADGINLINGTVRYTCTECNKGYTEEFTEEGVTAIFGGSTVRQRPVGEGTYVTFIASEEVKDGETGAITNQPAERYFSIKSDKEDGATYTVTLLYGANACALPDGMDAVYGDGASFSVYIAYNQTFVFALTTNEFTVSADYCYSYQFRVEAGDPPPLGTADRPISVEAGENKLGNVVTGLAVYYKLDTSELGYNVALTFGSDISVYCLGVNLNGLDNEGNDVSYQISSGDTLALSKYGYTTYLYIVSESGEISFNVEKINLAGSAENPIELELGESYTTKEFSPDYTEEWYMYTPETTGYYSVAGGTDLNIFVFTSVTSTEEIAFGRGACVSELTAGTTYYIQVYNYVSDGYSGSATFTFGAASNTGYSATDPKTVYAGETQIDGADTNVQYYIYTATNTGVVDIKWSGSSTYFTIAAKNNSSSFTSGNKGSVSNRAVTAGDTILMYLYNGTAGNITITLSIDGSEALPFTAVNTENTGTTTTDDNYSEDKGIYYHYYKYSYAATQSGTLEFSGEGIIGISTLSFAEAGLFTSENTLSVLRGKTYTVYIAVGSVDVTGSYSFDITFTPSGEDDENVEPDGSSAYPYTVEATNTRTTTEADAYYEYMMSYYHCYIYTATAAGTVTFASDDMFTEVLMSTVSFDDALGYTQVISMTGSYKFDVEAGDKIYICAYYWGVGEYTFTMSFEGADPDGSEENPYTVQATNMRTTTTADANYNNIPYHCYTYTATEAGKITITSGSLTMVYLSTESFSEALGSSKTAALGQSYEIEVEAGATVYAVAQYLMGTGEYSFTMTFEEV